MQLFLPTTLLVLLSARLATAVPVSPSRTTSIPNSDCGIICRLSHLWDSEDIVTPSISRDPIPISDSTDGAQPYTEGQGPWAPPSSLTHTSAALSAKQPLSSSYLWSLDSEKQPKPILQPGQDVHKVKAVELKENAVPVSNIEMDITHLTSSPRPLHTLPKSEQANFWTTEHALRRHREKQGGCHGDAGFVYLPGNIYVPSENHDSHRMDVVVLVAGMLFIALLVCVEAAGTIKRHFQNVVLSRCTSIPSKLQQGGIYLSEDEPSRKASILSSSTIEKHGLDDLPGEQV